MAKCDLEKAVRILTAAVYTLYQEHHTKTEREFCKEHDAQEQRAANSEYQTAEEMMDSLALLGEELEPEEENAG